MREEMAIEKKKVATETELEGVGANATTVVS